MYVAKLNEGLYLKKYCYVEPSYLEPRREIKSLELTNKFEDACIMHSVNFESDEIKGLQKLGITFYKIIEKAEIGSLRVPQLHVGMFTENGDSLKDLGLFSKYRRLHID